MNSLVFSIIALAGVAVWYYLKTNSGGEQEPENECCEVSCCGGCDLITNDPSTWPTGNKIWDAARAIALAEGANIAGSNPDRLNNPGDISDGYNVYGGESHSGSNITQFPTKTAGWQELYNKLNRIVNGDSAVYSPDFTWNQIAQKWAGDWENWVTNVTDALNLSPDDRFGDFFGA